MTEPSACTRHDRSVWIASCDDCTAWHLAALGTRRGEPAVDLPAHDGDSVPSAA